MKKQIIGQTFPLERDLYAVENAELIGCVFEGEADGESALKECRGVIIKNCRFSLRYPLWHGTDFSVSDSHFTSTARAPMWYDRMATARHCRIECVKALRECDDTLIDDCVILSSEFGWNCRGVVLRNSDVTSDYLFFGSKRLEISRIKMSGKYSFQYVEDASVSDSVLNTKDAFWHAKNVTVSDCEVNGEYLGWYSENLTLVNCKISGTQPFCYCKGLRLINCEMTDCDLAFEYSEVEADINGSLLSVKNPLSGRICADGYGNVIFENSIRECTCEIITKGENK